NISFSYEEVGRPKTEDRSPKLEVVFLLSASDFGLLTSDFFHLPGTARMFRSENFYASSVLQCNITGFSIFPPKSNVGRFRAGKLYFLQQLPLRRNDRY